MFHLHRKPSHYFIIVGGTVRLNNDNLWCIFSVVIILNLQTWLLRCGTKFTTLSPHMFGLWSQAGMFSHSVVLSCTSSNRVYSRKFSPINSLRLVWSCWHFVNSIVGLQMSAIAFLFQFWQYMFLWVYKLTLWGLMMHVYQWTWTSLV